MTHNELKTSTVPYDFKWAMWIDWRDENGMVTFHDDARYETATAADLKAWHADGSNKPVSNSAAIELCKRWNAKYPIDTDADYECSEPW